MSEPFDEADNMCPNCVTPWKCNGPHLTTQTPYALKQAALKFTPRAEGSHPEDRCQRCAGHNATWYAPNDLWNAVMRDDRPEDFFGIVCPVCFAELAEERGLGLSGAWTWQPHD